VQGVGELAGEKNEPKEKRHNMGVKELPARTWHGGRVVIKGVGFRILSQGV